MPLLKKTLLLPLFVIAVGEAAVLGGLWLGIRHETREVNRTVNEVSDLKDPSPFRAALMGHLGKIQVGLEGYLRSPDPSLEAQIAESRQDFDKLLPEFARQNPKLFPQTANEEIKRTFGMYKEAIDRTLQANSLRMDRREILEQNFARILYLIDHNLRPMIRKDQADGEERGESVLNIENQMRAWQHNLSQAWAQPSEAAKELTFENESRGETYVELYSRLELLPRERKIQRDIRAIWLANSDLARESFVKESLVSEAEKNMNGERETVVLTLNKYLPAMPPAEFESKKQSILTSMRLHLAAAVAIGLFGLASLIAASLGIYRLIHKRARTADGIFRMPSTEPSAQPSQESTLQMDLKGTITAWNETAEALYGYGSSEALGQSISKLFESESEIARLGQELQKAKRATFETTHKTKAGMPFRVQIEFHPVADASGHATAISLICNRR